MAIGGAQQQDPTTLVGWIRKICLRPGMYLVGAPDHVTVNVSYLFAFINGYNTALHSRGLPSEYVPFRAWIYERRPELAHNSDWFGGVLLRELGGDHLRVLAQIDAWAEEFERTVQRQR